MDEKAEFSKRLNTALDDIGAPEKHRGRQKALQKIMEAQGTEITENAVRKWLESDGIPQMDNLIRLARGVNKSLEWLGTGRGSDIVPSQHVKEDAGQYTAPRYQKLIAALDALPAPLGEQTAEQLLMLILTLHPIPSDDPMLNQQQAQSLAASANPPRRR